MIEEIHQGNCVDILKDIPENSVDLVIADPPYNISANGGGWKWEEKNWEIIQEEWDSFEWNDYEKFTYNWIKSCSSPLKPSGSIFVFCSYHNSPFVNLGIRRVGQVLNEIIWYKRNAFPNMSGRRFTASHENILWGHLNGDKGEYSFYYDKIKEEKFSEDRFDSYGKQVRTVWDIPNYKDNEEVTDHPSQKPENIIKRLMESTTTKGDVVLDPFLGSGTTTAVAKKNGRKWIGIEKDEKYVKMAKERMDNIKNPSSVSDW